LAVLRFVSVSSCEVASKTATRIDCQHASAGGQVRCVVFPEICLPRTGRPFAIGQSLLGDEDVRIAAAGGQDPTSLDGPELRTTPDFPAGHPLAVNDGLGQRLIYRGLGGRSP